MVSQTEPEEAAATPPPGILEVMADITFCQTTLLTKINAVPLNMGLIWQDLDKKRAQLTLCRAASLPRGGYCDGAFYISLLLAD